MAYRVPVTKSRSAAVAVTVASCALVGASLSSCALAETFVGCSSSELEQTDQVAQRVWQLLDSSEPDGGAYCDSSPDPSVGGRMDGPSAGIVARAVDELGCVETTVEGFDSGDSAMVACTVDGAPYLIEIAREVDPYGSPGLEVGLYRR